MRDINQAPLDENRDDKRKYFRVDDMAFLSYRVVSWAEVRDKQKPKVSKQAAKLTCRANLDRLSRELQPLYNVIKLSNSNVANYLNMLDKKLTLLSDCLLEDEEFEVSVEPQEINISGGGLLFASEKPLAVGSMLELTMRLMPEDVIIYSYAKIITCTDIGTDGEESSVLDNNVKQLKHKIGVEFEFMDDDVRDIITRHVLIREQSLINKL